MDIKDILKACDHTLLSPAATWEQIEQLCKDGIKYKTASVCIPPSYVKSVKETFSDRIKICTVIGFPNGYNTTEAKLFEVSDAINNGADEVDTVINLGWLKDKNYNGILCEIKRIKNLCDKRILKVIIEACLLSDEEKIEMCRIISDSGADYIKTSTGFSTGGATFSDVKLFSQHIAPTVKIKAAGGISTIVAAEKFLNSGASRLGTSRIVNLAKELY